MTAENAPWEPPLAADGDTHLLASLERMRATFRWKADGLDAAGLSTRIGASTLTLGGLLRHLAGVERIGVLWKCFGENPGEPWASADWDADPEWEFTSAADLTPLELYAGYDEAVALARERIARALTAPSGLGAAAHISDSKGHQANVRRVIADLVEEYGRHTGHADLLREAVDGRVGEDPPRDWLPPYFLPLTES